MVVELGGPPESLGHFNSGRRRYMLARPLECRNAYLLPKGHPSGRHSEIDWSRPVDGAKFPKWAKMRALDVFRSWIFAERSPYSVTPIPNVGLKWPAVPPQSPSA